MYNAIIINQPWLLTLSIIFVKLQINKAISKIQSHRYFDKVNEVSIAIHGDFVLLWSHIWVSLTNNRAHIEFEIVNINP